MEFGQKCYTSKMDPARRLLKLWEYSKVSQQKGELKVKKKVLVPHYSFHHLKLVWTRWRSWWQGHHSEMMLMCLPSETPKWTGPVHWSCISVSGWWTCAHGLGLTQLPLLGLGQGTAFWTKVVEEGVWWMQDISLAAALGNDWGGEGEPHELNWAAWEKVLFSGETQPWLGVQHSIQPVSQRSGHCRGVGRELPGLGLPRDALGQAQLAAAQTPLTHSQALK